MATIKQIDGRSVHQIQSGQVIVDLCSVVKELVENSVDSGATIIDVRFKNQGLDSIEVQDNGSGISPANYSSVALKHYTSKLSSYSDIESLQTFGFRGEALASLCALSILTVTTCQEEEAPKGSKLTFHQSGELDSTTVVAAQRGTTVAVENLFHNLPVRRRELDRNIKREWHKVIALLNQYACILTNVKFSVSQQPTKGKRILLFSTKGNATTRENIINIFGAKTLAALIPLDLHLELKPSGTRSSDKSASNSHDVRIVGHVSKPAHGEGRQTPDRQMFFVNGRPCSLPQLAKAFNEVYRSYNNSQSPFIFADVQLDTMLYDVNVSPDKRSILLHDQNNLLDTLRTSLSELFDTHEDSISIAASTQNVKLQASHGKGTKPGQLPRLFDRLPSTSHSTPQVEQSLSYEDNKLSSGADSEVSEPDNGFAPASRLMKTRSQRNEKEKLHLNGNIEPVIRRVITSSPEKTAPATPRLKTILVNHSPARKESSAISSANAALSQHQGSHDPDYNVRAQVSGSSSPVTPDISVEDVGVKDLREVVTPSRDVKSPTKAADVEDESKSPETGMSRPTSPKQDEAKEILRPGIHESDSEPDIQRPTRIQSNTRAINDDTSSGQSQHDEQSLETEPDIQHVKPTLLPTGGDSPIRSDNTRTLLAESRIQPPKPVRRKDITACCIQNLHVEKRKLRLLHNRRPRRHTSQSGSSAHNTSSVERIDASDAESRLPLIISKGDFSKMRIIGQFNLGFIIAVKPASHLGSGSEGKHDELFIIDQHASDEKYNYERLQNTTEIQSQRLVHPMRLQLTALEEEIILENSTALNANGFKVDIDTTGRFPVGSRCLLTSLPLSREVTFKLDDLEELISLLGDKSAESSYIPRPSKVQKIKTLGGMASIDDVNFELPKLRTSFSLENDTRFLGSDDNIAEFFDVKFCPYQPLDHEPVFAAISKKHVVICRLTKDTGDVNPCHVINVIRDDDDEAASCCCTWTMDAVNGRPYICIGGVDAKVKIYDVVDGRLVECFVGHGGDVNDLATSPVNPYIIASASDDTSVRIWSVEEKHRSQPCLCILAGEGHSWNLLSVAFHETGRYLLSGGHDQIINLWTIPDLPNEPIDTPLQVHYPHFSTSAVHSGIVDCVSFYGDLILSRACHDNVIVLWKIEGFSSDDPLPPQSTAPTPQNVLPTNYEDPGRLTRSAFVPLTSPQCPVQYTRLLAFHTPNCGPQFFMRFKLHHVPNQNPVLAFCNAAGNIFFWDLKRLTAHRDIMSSLANNTDKSKPIQLPSWQKPVIPRAKADPPRVQPGDIGIMGDQV
ncbi:hypothetical protein A0O28_0010600 [Trichoderma guizhouense]|uniref:DNA mismatch repair protein PMS1 n=1 Tax=Trichoderma guizhouense TaxID=1491466 RepID=A0A1T3CA32_9HYPO|nr:hypothetical protein A0O28_0010600 [Trichoderma guizhouense]